MSVDLAAAVARWTARCSAVDAELRAFVDEPERAARLEREARELAERFPADERPPLWGVLLAVKDVFRVAGLPTRAGTRLDPGLFAGPEASSVTRLRDAGALVVGKTVSTELAYFAPGPTRNPHDSAHTPGGSSSGSAAAVAAGLADLALGTQTIGSVCRPAAFCGVVGWKPSRGRVAADGVVPLAPSLDHVGLFAGDVALVRRAAPVLVDDWRDVGELPVAGLGLALPTGPYAAHAGDEARRRTGEVVAALTGAGATVREVAVMDDFDDVVARHRRIVDGELFRVHGHLLAAHRDALAPRTVELMERGRGVDDATLEADRAACPPLHRELEDALAAAGADLWITPAAPGPAPRGLESTGDPVMNLPWTQAGLPAIVLPAGRAANGLPLGVQLVGRHGGDEELLARAAAIAEVLAARFGS